MSLAKERLLEERKQWRKQHPFGFVARPREGADGSLNLFIWDCKIPGKKSTLWEPGVYPIVLTFSESYPSQPPHCAFEKGFFHPNVFPSGTVCLSILNADKGWKPSLSIPEILLGIQDLLDAPNASDPAQQEAYDIYVSNRKKYNERVVRQADQYKP